MKVSERVATVQAKIFGDYALFTRPEGKVERVSYEIMTPSAARGALEAIFWKPEFKYRIRKIATLKKPRFHSIVRNEVSKKASINKAFMSSPKEVFTDDMRQLRHALVLKDVAYIIEADIVLEPETKDSVRKYEAMFNRRVSKGQCFHRPYLGTREFSAHFEAVDGTERPIDWNELLGTMFFDFRFSKGGPMTIPYFFQAQVEAGVMAVPDYLYEEVYR